MRVLKDTINVEKKHKNLASWPVLSLVEGRLGVNVYSDEYN
jgi:hypothetical protein